MTGVAEVAATERFRTAIAHRMGLQFDDSKMEFLSDVLRRRIEKMRSTSWSYLEALEGGPCGAELSALAQELTVTETYFFRNKEQFNALAERVLPERLRVQQHVKRLRILSAGCASGEEAYSIAIMARQVIADSSWDLMIRAVDLNPAGLEKAARGRYPAWALRETPPDIQRRWFRPDGRDMVLEESLRADLIFEAKNLAVDDADLWPPQAYDVVFFRNVLMYFSPAQMRAAVARVAASLAPGGFLFLGHAETLRGISEDYHLCHTHETFYYQRKEGAACVVPFWPAAVPYRAYPLMPAIALGDSWVDTIRESAARVAALIPAQGPQAESEAEWDRSHLLDLLVKERFTEALAYYRDLPAARSKDPDLVLLEAILLAHSCDFERAEDAARRLLSIDEMNAGAHYVLALCREAVGDRIRAIEHNRVAANLDPAFAMPRLHLGLLTRRAGEWGPARAHLEQALILLKREDASRLLLFGGGFNRTALVALCESALRDCKERA